MITEEQKNQNTQRIIELLESTNRPGIQSLIIWLAGQGFFSSPASTKYHGNHPGGLAEHSISVMQHFAHLNDLLYLAVPKESVIIAAILHDICKVGAYIGDSVKYEWNKAQPSGHAELSITRAERFIKLTDTETALIRYHMGPYAHTTEQLKVAWSIHPECKFFYFTDEMSAAIERRKGK